jgi:hypothetical protein
VAKPSVDSVVSNKSTKASSNIVLTEETEINECMRLGTSSKTIKEEKGLFKQISSYCRSGRKCKSFNTSIYLCNTKTKRGLDLKIFTTDKNRSKVFEKLKVSMASGELKVLFDKYPQFREEFTKSSISGLSHRFCGSLVYDKISTLIDIGILDMSKKFKGGSGVLEEDKKFSSKTITNFFDGCTLETSLEKPAVSKVVTLYVALKSKKGNYHIDKERSFDGLKYEEMVKTNNEVYQKLKTKFMDYFIEQYKSGMCI